MPRFSVSFSFYCCFFPSISIDDIGATFGVFFLLDLLSLFPNGFLLCDHGLDSINQSINVSSSNVSAELLVGGKHALEKQKTG